MYEVFVFRLTDREAGSDILFYEILEHGQTNICLKVVFFAVDTTRHCEPSSRLDLVQFFLLC